MAGITTRVGLDQSSFSMLAGITATLNSNAVWRLARLDDADPVIGEFGVTAGQFGLWHVTRCELLLADWTFVGVLSLSVGERFPGDSHPSLFGRRQYRPCLVGIERIEHMISRATAWPPPPDYRLHLSSRLIGKALNFGKSKIERTGRILENKTRVFIQIFAV